MKALDVAYMGEGVAWRDLITVARSHYVLARVAFQCNMIHTGCLLAHQTVETYTKAIMRVHFDHYYFAKTDDPAQCDKIRVWGHDLIKLLEKVKVHSPIVDSILKDKELSKFLQTLFETYNQMRYAEVTFSALPNTIIEWCDQVANILDKEYFHVLNIQVPAFYVPDPILDLFLLNNSYFKRTNAPNAVEPS